MRLADSQSDLMAAAATAFALALKLDWRARLRSVGAKHAAIAGLWAQQSVTSLAFVKKLAGICRHFLDLSVAAMRTGDLGTKFGLHERSDGNG